MIAALNGKAAQSRLAKPLGRQRLSALAYTFEEIPLGELIVHPRVQRAFNASGAQRIAKTFNQIKLGVLSILRTPVGYLVIDGQHRMWAMQSYLGEGWEIIPVPCHVYPNLTDAEAAELSEGLNDHRAWGPVDIFINAVIAKHPQEVAINELVLKMGLKIARAPSANTVRCVKTLRQVHEWPNGPDILTNAVSFLHSAWPSSPESKQGDLIAGMALLLLHHGDELDQPALLKRLTAHLDPSQLLGAGRGASKVIGRGIPYGVMHALIVQYNMGRRHGKLPT